MKRTKTPNENIRGCGYSLPPNAPLKCSTLKMLATPSSKTDCYKVNQRFNLLSIRISIYSTALSKRGNEMRLKYSVFLI